MHLITKKSQYSFSLKSITFQFSKCVICFFIYTIISNAGISKSQLCHWKLRVVSEKTAILSPCVVILIAVTVLIRVCGCVVQAARTFVWIRIDSSPVKHFLAVECHPPAVCFTIAEECRVIALVLYKLLTVNG